MAGSALDRALAYSPGQDCQCSAYGECECGCSAEWTPRINKIVAAWRDMPAAEMRLRCGELTAQEIRTVRAVLNAILANGEYEPRQRAIDVLCRHTYAEREREMLIGFREAVRRIAAKPIDSSDMMDEIEHLLSLPQNIRRSDTP